MFDESVKNQISTRSHKDHKEKILNLISFSLRGFVALCETKTFYDLIMFLQLLIRRDQCQRFFVLHVWYSCINRSG